MLWLLCRTSCKIIAGAARRAHSAHRTPSCARRRGQHRPCWPRSDRVSALERGSGFRSRGRGQHRAHRAARLAADAPPRAPGRPVRSRELFRVRGCPLPEPRAPFATLHLLLSPMLPPQTSPSLQQVLDKLRPSHAHDRHAACSALRHRSQLARPLRVGRAAPSSSAHTHFTTSDGFVDACRYEC